MENIWEYWRANELSATVWDGYDAEAWNGLVNDRTASDLSAPEIGRRSMFTAVGVTARSGP
jgi:hypothetical protein